MNPNLPPNNQNQFDMDDEHEHVMSMSLGSLAGMEEYDNVLELYSPQNSSTKISLVKKADFHAGRDAVMLEATLFTTLPLETWNALCNLIYLKHIAPSLAPKNTKKVPVRTKKPQ